MGSGMRPEPFVRESGRGPGVVCLHSNASSSAQWRSFAELVADRYRVFAVDGHGVGRSPEWPADEAADLEREVDLIEPVLDRAGNAFHLVGHSYGGAVALLAAARHARRVRSVVVYEPTLFALVAGQDPAASPAAGIWRAASDAAAAVDRGDLAVAAQRFVDFWSAEGAWEAMPPARQDAVIAPMHAVGRWRDATFARTLSLGTFRRVAAPVLLMWGERSPESSLSVARLLAATLAAVTTAPQPGLGHMGPVMDPGRINVQIARFLDDHRGATSNDTPSHAGPSRLS